VEVGEKSAAIVIAAILQRGAAITSAGRWLFGSPSAARPRRDHRDPHGARSSSRLTEPFGDFPSTSSQLGLVTRHKPFPFRKYGRVKIDFSDGQATSPSHKLIGPRSAIAASRRRHREAAPQRKSRPPISASSPLNPPSEYAMRKSTPRRSNLRYRLLCQAPERPACLKAK
jgi:hypothetical protein